MHCDWSYEMEALHSKILLSKFFGALWCFFRTSKAALADSGKVFFVPTTPLMSDNHVALAAVRRSVFFVAIVVEIASLNSSGEGFVVEAVCTRSARCCLCCLS